MGDAVIQQQAPSAPNGRHEPLLAFTGVSMEYTRPSGGRIAIVHGLTFGVGRGEFVCIAGRSGSGKTTVLMLAAGLLAPTTGSISWHSLALDTISDHELTSDRGRHVGLVFQNGGLISSLRASENVALPGMAVPHGSDAISRVDAKSRVAELLDQVGLPDRAAHFPAALSGGEQQRVALARALFRDPPLLLIDEPTANLDRQSATAIIDLLVRLRDTGRGILVASHDEQLIRRADRVIQMEIE